MKNQKLDVKTRKESGSHSWNEIKNVLGGRKALSILKGKNNKEAAKNK